MASNELNAVLRYFNRFGSRADSVEDAALLQRFAVQRDESAFATIVERHGPVVWAACQRLLLQPADRQDVFQATFLVLVRKAGRLRQPERLGPWLHGVAFRIAMKLRTNEARRKEQPLPFDEPARVQADSEMVWRDLRPVLDEEIDRLPERYRVPFVLCYLQNLTNEEAARQLGCPLGTVQSRLSRARERLRSRLTQRGIGVSSTGLAAVLVTHAGVGAVPAGLVTSTVKLGMAFTVGLSAASIGASAVILAKGALQTMFFMKIKLACVMLLALGVVGFGGSYLGHQMTADAQEAGKKPTVAKPGANAPTADQAETKAKPLAPTEPARTGSQIASRLAGPVVFNGLDSNVTDANVTFDTILNQLREKYNLEFIVNERAFKDDLRSNVMETIVTNAAPIPSMKTSLGRVLTFILGRIPASSGAIYLIRKDHIEITTVNAARAELKLAQQHPWAPLVYEDFKDVPWLDAIHIIGDRDEVNLVVDPQAVEKAREVKVSARLHNLPVATAAAVLAEMADLKLTELGSVLFITTPEKAARLSRERHGQPGL